MSVGVLDLFVDEEIEYARRLIRAGVLTELHLYPDTFHDYNLSPDAWMSRAVAPSLA
jgi:acetyl esterase/lipase